MVAAPLLTVAVRVWGGGVHPSGIGVLRPVLNGVCAQSARTEAHPESGIGPRSGRYLIAPVTYLRALLVPELSKPFVVDPQVMRHLVEHRLANLAPQPRRREPQLEVRPHEHGDPIRE